MNNCGRHLNPVLGASGLWSKTDLKFLSCRVAATVGNPILSSFENDHVPSVD